MGVGLIGGSFALACREAVGCQLFGVDKDPNAVQKAKELGILHEGSTQVEDLKGFNPQLVVLATPVGSFTSLARRLRETLSPECVVSDVGSVKGRLVYELEEILGGRYVGGHPIAGTEKAGVQHAERGLFSGRRFILTPTQRTDPRAKTEVKELWQSMGALVEEMDPELHDFIFGAVSHMPHAVAFALVRAIEYLSNSLDLFKYPGGGFKDFTRIAGSDPVMWRDIFLHNSEQVLKSLQVFEGALRELQGLIERREKEALTQYLGLASARRRSLSE